MDSKKDVNVWILVFSEVVSREQIQIKFFLL